MTLKIRLMSMIKSKRIGIVSSEKKSSPPSDPCLRVWPAILGSAQIPDLLWKSK